METTLGEHSHANAKDGRGEFMIKVIHTHLDKERLESEFENIEDWNSFLASNQSFFAGYNHDILDITNEVNKKIALITRDQELQACNEVIKLVGLFNKSKPEGTVLTVLQTPQMQAVIFALLTGAPKTAKGAILQMGVGLYTDIELSEVISILDKVI